MLQEALAQHQAGRLREAEAAYRAVLASEPNSADALHLLGVALHQLGRHEEAAGFIGQAIGIDAARPEFHNNLGEVQRALGRFADAERSYRAALALNPELTPAHGNLGHALLAQKRFQEAAANYALAAERDEGNAAVLVNLAYALVKLGRLPEAEQRSRQALALLPGEAEAHLLLAMSLAGLERFDEAAASYRRALALRPDYVEAHVNLGQLCLMLGDYAEGWKHYAWRRKRDAAEWTGAEDLRGKSILLQYEQGLGDTIHFCRYAPLVAARGAKVTLQVPAALAPLLQGLGEIVAEGAPPPQTDFRCPLLALPGALGTTLETIPAEIPYLRADPAGWRAKLGGDGLRLVGLCWRGSPHYAGDRHRSLPFAAIEPLLSVPGARFVSLQKDQRADERAPNLLHPGLDFAGTASLVAALDLVISVDTVWAHWAGAAGRPVWLLLSRIPHWCWMLEREDSPWYPTARLFRQQRQGDWAPVVERIARELGRRG